MIYPYSGISRARAQLSSNAIPINRIDFPLMTHILLLCDVPKCLLKDTGFIWNW